MVNIPFFCDQMEPGGSCSVILGLCAVTGAAGPNFCWEDWVRSELAHC